MLLESEIRKTIIADTYLSGKVGDRIYLTKLPKDFKLPCIRIVRRGGPGGMQTFPWNLGVVPFTILADSEDEAMQIFEDENDGGKQGLKPLFNIKRNYRMGKLDIFSSVVSAGPVIAFYPEIERYGLDGILTFKYYFKK